MSTLGPPPSDLTASTECLKLHETFRGGKARKGRRERETQQEQTADVAVFALCRGDRLLRNRFFGPGHRAPHVLLICKSAVIHSRSLKIRQPSVI